MSDVDQQSLMSYSFGDEDDQPGHMYAVHVKCRKGTKGQDMLVSLNGAGAIVASRIQSSSKVMLAVVTGRDAATISECCRLIEAELGEVISFHRLCSEREYEVIFSVNTLELTYRPFVLGVSLGVAVFLAVTSVFKVNKPAWIVASTLLGASAIL